MSLNFYMSFWSYVRALEEHVSDSPDNTKVPSWSFKFKSVIKFVSFDIL